MNPHRTTHVPRGAPVLLFALSAAVSVSCLDTGRVEARSVRIESPAMGRRWPALILLPPFYASDTGRRYPVLYLLHGANGEHTSWYRNTPLARLLRTRELIVVCPFGRVYGWYVDSPRRRNSNVETHLIGELIPYVDTHFRTDARREARAIAGYSMGGHGALTLAAKHPKLFTSASSLSGILDLARWPGHWGLEGTLGDPDEHGDLWAASSAMGLAERFLGPAKGTALLIDCGRGDVAFEENREFHELLDKLGVPHVYEERAGRHDWRYWSSHLEEHLDFHLESMNSPPTRHR